MRCTLLALVLAVACGIASPALADERELHKRLAGLVTANALVIVVVLGHFERAFVHDEN